MPPPLPSPSAALEALALIDHGLRMRALRLALFMAAAPGEWTQQGLAAALKMGQADVSVTLRDLMAGGLVTMRQNPEAPKGQAINLYRITA
jgi:predicted transcriptional regulator